MPQSSSRAALVTAFLSVAPLCGVALPDLARHAGAATLAQIPYSGVSPGGVDMSSGELILVMRPDLALDGPMPVTFGRYYASMLARDGLAPGHLGPNWLGTYDWSLSTSGTLVNVVTNRGQLIQFQQNESGYVLVQPTDEQYRLVSVGGSWRFTDPSRRRIFLFDGSSRLLTQILDEHGNALNLTYTGGRLSQVSDGLGRTLTFGYDPLGKLVSASDGTRSVSFSYSIGVLTGVTDMGGHTFTFAYDSGPVQGLLTGVTEPAGNTPLAQSYDPLGRVSTQTDALGHVAGYAYGSPTGNTFTDPLGIHWTYLHDSQNRLQSLTDPASGVTSYTYDALGRPVTRTRPLGDQTSLAYDPTSGYPRGMTLADGSVIGWGYSSHSVGGATMFDLSIATYPDGASESYGRDAAGNLTDFTDRGGFLWHGTYNTRGQLLTSTNPTSGVTTLTYDPQGRPATERDNAGNTTNFTYDGLSRLVKTTWPDASFQSFAYDNLNGMTSFTDERGKVWNYAYDSNERLMTETDPLLETTGFAYDGLDRVTQVVDPLGHARAYAYDLSGRLKSMTDRSGRTMSYQYDALGRLSGVTDPADGTALYSYDADSRLISAQDPLGHSTTFAYDARDRVTHVTDPVGAGFDHAYDSMGRLTSSAGPIEATETFGYDPRGLMTLAHRFTVEIDFAHTPLGEASALTDPNHNAWLRAYDPQGRPTSSADPLGRTSNFAYDSRSRITHADLPLGSVNFTYDPASDGLECQWLDGTTLTYGYDDARRLVSGTGATFTYDAAGRMTSSNGLAMTYDNEGRLLSETFAPGKVVMYTYDVRGLLSQVTDWMGGTTTFAYDAAGRLSTVSRPTPNGIATTYQYDAADRLIQSVERQPGSAGATLSSITLTRDAMGRPTSIDRHQPLMPGVTSPSTTGFAYDAASEVEGLSWDPLGRLVSDGSRAFQWDGASRLTSFVAGADNPQFTYDAFGRMLSRAQGTLSEHYVWNYAFVQQGRVWTDAVMQAGTPLRYYVHTPSGLLLYSVDGSTGARTFYHYDESGNTIFLTNEAGSVTAEYAYTPDGGVSGLGEITGNDYTLGAAQGMMWLRSGGLFRNGPAIYDAATRRVISDAGFFMHEIGHTLNLHHGGTDPGSVGPVRNPNFMSIMNYRYQLGGISHASGLAEVVGNDAIVSLGRGAFRPDYSHTALTELLDEDNDGLNDTWEDQDPIDLNCDGRRVGDGNSDGVLVGGVHTIEGLEHEHEIVEYGDGGETRESHYKKPAPAFEIKDFGFEVTNPSTIGSATGGAGGGKAKFNEFTITKTTDRASPTFFKNCCAGAHYKTAIIAVRKAGDHPNDGSDPYLHYKFGTIFTTKIKWSHADEEPEETITFVYGKLGVDYHPQNPSTGRCTWCPQ